MPTSELLGYIWDNCSTYSETLTYSDIFLASVWSSVSHGFDNLFSCTCSWWLLSRYLLALIKQKSFCAITPLPELGLCFMICCISIIPYNLLGRSQLSVDDMRLIWLFCCADLMGLSTDPVICALWIFLLISKKKYNVPTKHMY